MAIFVENVLGSLQIGGDQLPGFAPYVEFTGFRRGRLLFGDGGWLRGFGFRRVLFRGLVVFVALPCQKHFDVLAKFLVRLRCWLGGLFLAGWSGDRNR